MVDHDDQNKNLEAESGLTQEVLRRELLAVDARLLIEGRALTQSEIALTTGGEDVVRSEAFMKVVEMIGWPSEDEGLTRRAVHYESPDEFRENLVGWIPDKPRGLNNFYMHFTADEVNIAAGILPKSKSAAAVYGCQPALQRAQVVAPDFIDALRDRMRFERETRKGDMREMLSDDTVLGLLAAYRLMSRLVAAGDARQQAIILGLHVGPNEIEPTTDAHIQLTQ